jgi:hypothetical protein
MIQVWHVQRLWEHEHAIHSVLRSEACGCRDCWHIRCRFAFVRARLHAAASFGEVHGDAVLSRHCRVRMRVCLHLRHMSCVSVVLDTQDSTDLDVQHGEGAHFSGLGDVVFMLPQQPSRYLLEKGCYHPPNESRWSPAHGCPASEGITRMIVCFLLLFFLRFFGLESR